MSPVAAMPNPDCLHIPPHSPHSEMPVVPAPTSFSFPWPIPMSRRPPALCFPNSVQTWGSTHGFSAASGVGWGDGVLPGHALARHRSVCAFTCLHVSVAGKILF